MWIGLQVVEFPGVNVVAVEAGELVAVVAHSVMRARRVEARIFVIMIVDGLAPVRGCAPAEQGDERAALDRVGSDHAGKREEGRRIVDVLDRCRDPRAGTDVAGILDQEGGAQRFYIDEALVEPAMRAAIKALVGGRWEENTSEL